jgi:hypothetical protein
MLEKRGIHIEVGMRRFALAWPFPREMRHLAEFGRRKIPNPGKALHELWRPHGS